MVNIPFYNIRVYEITSAEYERVAITVDILEFPFYSLTVRWKTLLLQLPSREVGKAFDSWKPSFG